MNLRDRLNIKDLDAMTFDTLQKIVDSGIGITNVTVGSVIRTIVEAILDNVDNTNYYAEYVYGAMGIDNATGDDLDRLILILGITREQSTHATGIVTFSTGDAPYDYDIPIPYGYEISTRQASDGTVYTYTVDEDDVVLTAGNTSIDVRVKAETPGHQYLPAGSLCVMGRSIIGIATATNQNEINSGSDQESDEALKMRVREYTKSSGKCTDTALKMAVESVDGVVSCTVDDQYDGVGTSGVIVVPEIFPVPDDVITAIDKVVKETKASGIRVFVIYPSIKNISVNVAITNVTNSTIILEAISNYANSLKVGQTFMVKQMERKILNAIDTNNVENDDIDINTMEPSSNVMCGDEEIIRINSITINGVKYDV